MNLRAILLIARSVLIEAVRRKEPVKLGTALVELFRPAGGVDLEIERDKTPAELPSFD